MYFFVISKESIPINIAKERLLVCIALISWEEYLVLSVFFLLQEIVYVPIVKPHVLVGISFVLERATNCMSIFQTRIAVSISVDPASKVFHISIMMR